MTTTEAIKDKKTLEELMGVYQVGSKNHLLIAYALNTGLRVSDILRANVKDSLRGLWVGEEQKTGKHKRVVLNDSLQLLIRRYIEEQGLTIDDYLFYSNKDKSKPITRIQAHRIIAKAGDMIGITLSAHSLRKTFGYISYKNGTDISLLMNLFNHSEVATTLLYIGITQDSIDDVFRNTRIGI